MIQWQANFFQKGPIICLCESFSLFDMVIIMLYKMLKVHCTDPSMHKTSWKFQSHGIFCYRVIVVGVMPVKWGFGGRGPVAIVTDGVNNSAKQYLSVSVITGGTNKNVSNNVKNFPFWRYHTTLKCMNCSKKKATVSWNNVTQHLRCIGDLPLTKKLAVCHWEWLI